MTVQSGTKPILLGHIAGAHGIRGEVLIKTYTANPEDIGAYGPLKSENDNRSFTVKVVRVTPKGVIARISGIADRNAAEPLRGTGLYADRAKLGNPEPGEYFHADLIGLAAHAPSGEKIGIVKSVNNFGAGDLLEVTFDASGKTDFVPFTDAWVPEVDIARGRLVLVLPVDDGSRREDEPPDADT